VNWSLNANRFSGSCRDCLTRCNPACLPRRIAALASFSPWLASTSRGERLPEDRLSLCFPYPCSKFGTGCQEFIHEVVILLRVHRLNCQELLSGHLNNHSFRCARVLLALFPSPIVMWRNFSHWRPPLPRFE
jgi:hypothetical protein